MPLFALLLTFAAAPQDAVDRHKPSSVSVSWELGFDFLDLRRIQMRSPDGETHTYWYMIYTATNTSGQTQHFFPIFEIVTEDLRSTPSDMGISPLVFEAIRERHRLTHPYLVHPTQAIGDIRSGEDNAIESVAIWPEIDLDVNQFKVFVGGLCGEKETMPNPAYDPSRPETMTVTEDGRERVVTVNPRQFTLRKTLEVPYTFPGAAATRSRVEPVRGKIRWIMR